jgi:hypothetical protein
MAFDWSPTVADIGALLRARTVDDTEQEVGTFNDTTRPTEAQVLSLIAMNSAVVGTRLGATEETDLCTEELKGSATEMAALRTAMQIELSYFPEQVAGNKSPYDRFKELYDEGMTSLSERVAQECGGGEGVGGEGEVPGAVSGDFGPYDSVGRDTIW